MKGMKQTEFCVFEVLSKGFQGDQLAILEG